MKMLNVCTMIIGLVVSISSDAYVAPEAIAACAKLDSGMQNVEVFSIESGQGNTYLRYQITIDGRIRSDVILLKKLVCETTLVKGLHTVICFSQTGSDKVFINVKTDRILSHQLILFANSTELQQRLTQLGVQMIPFKNVVLREYATNDHSNMCRFF